MVLVAALAAEVHRVEALLWVAGQELLSLDGHVRVAGRLERRERVAGAGDELVQLEGEEARASWLARRPRALGFGHA